MGAGKKARGPLPDDPQHARETIAEMGWAGRWPPEYCRDIYYGCRKERFDVPPPGFENLLTFKENGEWQQGATSGCLLADKQGVWCHDG